MVASDLARFNNYLTSVRAQVFANLQKERAIPSYIWTAKGPSYEASFEEVWAALATYLRKVYRPLWNSYSHWPTQWHLTHQEGLIAWANEEAFRRLNYARKRAFTLAEFEKFCAADQLSGLIQKPGTTIEREDGELFAKLLSPGLKSGKFGILINYLNRKGFTIPVNQRFLCIYYDRYHVPLRYWNSRSIADALPLALKAIGVPSTGQLNMDLIRKWLSRLGLCLADPPIMTEFNLRTRTIKFNDEAARHHGLPPDIITPENFGL